MKSHPLNILLLAALGSLMLMIPSVVPAETDERSGSKAPPIEQHLVREADLAVKLVIALELAPAADEAEAVRRLTEIGIAPKSGWIADRPVTPEIVGEVRLAVDATADTGKLSMERYRALQEFDRVLVGLGLPFAPYTAETAYQSDPVSAAGYVAPDVVNNYYYANGPPVITYYPPPPTFTSLYLWVPYPFWTDGFLFPGYYILHDFQNSARVHRRSYFGTGYYRQSRLPLIFRDDQGARDIGDSFVFKRGHSSRVLSSSGFKRGDRNFTDRHRPGSLHHGRTFSPHWQGNREFSRRTGERNLDSRRFLDSSRTSQPSSQRTQSFKHHSGDSGRNTPHFRGGGTAGQHSHGSSSFNRPSAHDGGFSHGGRGRR